MPRRRAAALPRISKVLSFPESTNFFQEKPGLPQVINHDLANINIESLIRIIRGQKVMFDSDLAMLYGVTTSRLNEQVKRNVNRFPDDFMFQLTKEEWIVLRSQIATAKDLKSQNVISNLSENKKKF